MPVASIGSMATSTSRFIYKCLEISVLNWCLSPFGEITNSSARLNNYMPRKLKKNAYVFFNNATIINTCIENG